MEKNN